MTEEITREVDLFGSIMKQPVIETEFNCEYAPLACIQPGMPIKFTVKGVNDPYLDLNNSHLHVLAKITKANGRNVGHTSQLYPYRSIIVCSTTARRHKRLDSCAKAGPRTQPGT